MDSIQILSFLFLPLLSFLLLIFFGKKIKKGSSTIALFLMMVMLINSILLLSRFIINNNQSLTKLESSFLWFSTGYFSVSLGYIIDNISVIMLFVVALIGFLVHLYSTEYMKDDPKYSRYFAFLGIFIFSMNGIIIADSLIMIYIFWELVGLSSFLLIGFWFEKEKPPLAANKAFLTNRVGDIGMFIGIMILYFNTGTFSIDEIIYSSKSIDMSVLTIAGLLVFMGAVGKSAQFPLHIWLPNAMEGPTPVSALIHAATMVAAGVYMTFRIFPFLTPDALSIIAIIGAVTAFGAAIAAITRNDIKAVLAYSTISQLGYMIMALGVGAHLYALFHLVTHAMFKACLFLCSGSVIHAMHHSLHELDDHDIDPQDMRNMGGLKNKMPITHIAMLISTLAIAGIPFFSGFLSKDGILAGTLSYYHLHHGWTFILPFAGFGAAMITAFYMFRLIFKTFYGKPANQKIYSHIHESPFPMTLPLIILSFLSFAFAFTLNINPLKSKGWFKDLIGYSKHNYLDMNIVKDGIYHAHDLAMYISMLMAVFGIFLAMLLYWVRYLDVDKFTAINKKIGLYALSKNKFYIDQLYTLFLYKPFIFLSWISSKIDWDIYDKIFINGWGWLTIKISKLSTQADYNFIDQIIIDGFGKMTRFLGSKLKISQNGVVQNYLLGGMLGLILLIIIIQKFN